VKPKKVIMMICLPKDVVARVKKARRKTGFNLSRFVEERWIATSGPDWKPTATRMSKDTVRTTINVPVGLKEMVGELRIMMPFNFSGWVAAELKVHGPQ
jgi:hypothetical protein